MSDTPAWDNDNDDDYDIEAATAARQAKIEAQQDQERITYKHSDFVYDTSENCYWNVPNMIKHQAISVDAMIPMEVWRLPIVRGNSDKEPKPIPPSVDIRRIESDQIIEGSTWWPGQPRIIKDYLATRQGTVPAPKRRLLNMYEPGPVPDKSLADQAQPWVDHVKKLYPNEIEHNYFFDYCAHMIQRPHEKANSAIVLSGSHGIGKDFMLHPVRMAVGHWNAENIDPDSLFERFNPWVKTLMLTVDEMQPSDMNHKANAVYNAMKTLIATPPNTIAMEDKRDKIVYVINVMRIFITTNERLTLFIPKEDRRIFLMHSRIEQDWHIHEKDPEYFERMFEWIDAGGTEAIAGWLAARDISKFKPKGKVPKTEAWAEIAQSWEASEDDELCQALEMLDYPDAVMLADLTDQIFDGADKLAGMIKSRAFMHRMLKEGYVSVPREPGQNDWQMQVNKNKIKCKNIFVKEKLKLSADGMRKLAWEKLKSRAEISRT